MLEGPYCGQSELVQFTAMSEDQLCKLIGSSVSKSCILDPIPATVLKKYYPILLPTITRIVNLSLTSSTVPDAMKIGALSPLLKTPSLDFEQFKNFRPISNLTFVSKSTEKAVAFQLKEHLHQNNLNELFQSAYKKHHSTETALLRVQNDILRALDSRSSVILLLLDLSAAFDTVDHQILLSRLSSRFGIKGAALQWFNSYLTNRKQFVYINDSRSSVKNLHCGVPQGSVLGPILYVLYISPIGDILRKHNIPFHLYADDIQLFVTFKPTVDGDIQSAIHKIETCAAEIDSWMSFNKLKLNNNKTELIHLSSRFSHHPIMFNVNFNGEHISPTSSARNIGVIFDKELSMVDHINTVCKSSFYYLHRISKIRRYLDMETTKILVHAFITSKLDNCNSLYYGLPKSLIKKLQRIQNAAAKLVMCAKKYDHVSPLLFSLHWLPVEQRISFKVLLLTYKSLHNLAPKYLKELLIPYTPQRCLRSSSGTLLTVVPSNMKSYGDRAFSVAAPIMWNKLPGILKSSTTLDIFKSKLKTHLFSIAFGSY